MEYFYSDHYREDPYDEVEAALAAGNNSESVRATLEARLLTEDIRKPRDEAALQRIEQQLAHIASIDVRVGVAV